MVLSALYKTITNHKCKDIHLDFDLHKISVNMLIIIVLILILILIAILTLLLILTIILTSIGRMA